MINGNVGVSPGTSITGFPAGTLTGTGVIHQTDAVATQAQADTTTAYNAAASLTPTTSGLRELNGLSLTPGVYSGGALSLSNNGHLTLAGTANSVWVFQAASSLTIGSGTIITLTGGASACNVFWKVGSSASLGSAAQFQGTILAKKSVTATTGATVVGRLLASTAAVTLDTNTITAPTGCTPGSAPVTSSSPAITSGTPTTATVGTAYDFRVTATGTPAPAYTVTSGTLPAGLTLNSTTGAITGTPTTAGSPTVTITASNGTGPTVSAIYTLTVRPRPAVTAPVATAPTPTAVAAATRSPPPASSPSRAAGIRSARCSARAACSCSGQCRWSSGVADARRRSGATDRRAIELPLVVGPESAPGRAVDWTDEFFREHDPHPLRLLSRPSPARRS